MASAVVLRNSLLLSCYKHTHTLKKKFNKEGISSVGASVIFELYILKAYFPLQPLSVPVSFYRKTYTNTEKIQTASVQCELIIY